MEKCCKNCVNTFFGRTCAFLKESNPEYVRLIESKSHGRIFDQESDYWKLQNLLEETICPQYKSIHIEYPLVVDKIEYDNIDYKKALGHEVGKLVAIRPCGEEYEGKTYLGIFIGDLPRALSTRYNRETHILNSSFMTNPAIYVPELKEIIFGDSSWWHEIESEEDLKEITTEDINNTWYVKLLKEVTDNENN